MTEATRGNVRADLAALTRLAETSIELVLRLQDASGAYPASPTFSAYAGYSWFRDGAFIADAMSAAGAPGSADRFFDWCSRIVLSRRDTIERVVTAAAAGTPVPNSQMLPARFTFDGQDGTDEWWDFQLDGYGTWLWAVAQHAERHDLALDERRDAIGLTVDYLLSSWRRPCFDWWEEHEEHVHVSTLACIAAGIRAVSGVLDAGRREAIADAVKEIEAVILAAGVVDGHLTKWIGSTELDASLLSAVAPLGLFPASGRIGAATIDVIGAHLTHERGVYRYLDDTFFGGGQWPLLSCFLGLALAEAGDRDAALEQLAWAAGTADPAGSLPEQVDYALLDATRRAEWVERWGPVAQPLLWSHAMFIRLALEVGVLEALDA